ncbi:MAG: enoyl-CoA hydratase/isomerase family protein [Candidatus Lambdaproteobacteria bacterium]|nr:enoyl-CoA hydratase/isomerase family protein [Candidatus Lambdaproteobacteria bacterium]
MPAEPHLKVELHDRVALVTLNRPDALNALSTALREQLLACLERLAADGAVRAVVLTGAGRAFSAGGDLKEAHRRESLEAIRRWEARSNRCRDGILGLLRRMPKPAIAAVNGVAAGAGANLALACDLRIASERAAFGQVFVRIGLHPDWGGSFLLPRLVGPAKAFELLLGGEIVAAPEALRLGMVNRVVPPEALLEESLGLAARLAEAPPAALAFAKRALYRLDAAAFEQALAYESHAQAICRATADFREGVLAFVEKRPAVFRGA